MRPTPSIRWAIADDVPALRAIYRESSLSNDGDRPLLTQHPELLHWSDEPVRQGRTRVVEVDGRVVGFATFVPHEGTADVEDLFVHPGWMRRGMGRALIEDLATIVQRAGSSRLEVDANPHALAFYGAVDFVALGEVALEHGRAVRMRRQLAP